MIEQIKKSLTCDPKKNGKCFCETRKEIGIKNSRLHYTNLRECVVRS